MAGTNLYEVFVEGRYKAYENCLISPSIGSPANNDPLLFLGLLSDQPASSLLVRKLLAMVAHSRHHRQTS